MSNRKLEDVLSQMLQDAKVLDIDIGNINDGYHSFEELYEHRNLLFCLVCAEDPFAWKSKLHADGTMFEGWFIAGTSLPTLTGYPPNDLTYHLPLSMWELFKGHELEKAPEFDGYTPQDVCDRMHNFLEMM